MSEHNVIKDFLECEVCNIYYEKGRIHCAKCGNKLVDVSLRTFVKYLTKEESKNRILFEYGENPFVFTITGSGFSWDSDDQYNPDAYGSIIFSVSFTLTTLGPPE